MQHVHREVRRLLREVRRPHRLEAEPVGLFLRSALQAPTARVAVLNLVRQALSPCSPELSTIVQRHDIDGAPAAIVARELFLSVRQFHRHHATAMEAIAAELARVTSIRSLPAASEAGDLDVCALYGRARHYWKLKTEAGFCHALALFERALEMDPGYASAYVGLAETYLGLAEYLIVPPAAAFVRASQMLERALELNPALPDAHAALADWHMWARTNFPRSRASLQQSFALDDHYSVSHLYGAWHGFLTGHLEESNRHVRRLMELDPTAIQHQITVGLLHAFSDNVPQAEAQFSAVLAMDPGNALAHLYLGMLYAHTGSYAAAISHLSEIADHEYRLQATAYLGYCHAKLGDSQAAFRYAQQLDVLAGKNRPLGFLSGLILAGLGERYAALDALERAVSQRDPWTVYIPVQPPFFSLRSEPRFSQLLKEIRKAA